MLAALQRNRVVREALVFLAFCGFTALLTWPYVLHLRDAVADPGDPYLVSWILWWDYHQTFTDPLNLFHANVFYPLRYTLAFSENSYGIALPFFPLYALGFRPLTVHAIAVFLGFASSGYGAFRLGRTLTGSTGVGWIAGVAFAFVPFRFSMLSHVLYLFSPWIPLVFEALVLFTRERNRKRALYLGIAFFMSGLTCITWFTFSLVPLAACAVVLLTRYGIWRDAAFWRRGIVAVGSASVLLLPFLLPYQFAAKLYGFRRSIDEVKDGSAGPLSWLAVERRNRIWRGLGDGLQLRFKFFPGLLPILLSLAAWFLAVRPVANPSRSPSARSRWIPWLDALAICALIVAVPVVATGGQGILYVLQQWITSERVLALFALALGVRFCLAYPTALRFQNPNFVETVRSERRSDAFWIGLILTLVGLVYSLGWNTFVYRFLYDLLPMFRSIRIAARGVMFAYLGLAVLAGIGAKSLAELVLSRRPRLRPAIVFGLLGALLLFELNAARLRFVRGDVDPDAVSLRLKETPMRVGIVILPANASVNHRHVLRAADHMKPLIVGTSGFNSPYEGRIEYDTRGGPIADSVMQMFEEIPASYLVISNHLIPPERRVDYEAFLARAVKAGRLRYINRFDARDDLYAVVKTEPGARNEAPLPFKVETKDWATLIEEDPVNLLGEHRSWAQAIYRLHLASYGVMPRCAEFVPEVIAIGRDVVASVLENQDALLEENLKRFVAGWVERPQFKERYDGMSDQAFVEAITANAGLGLAAAERTDMVDKLRRRSAIRAEMLLSVAKNKDFIAKHQTRSLVLLHYFGYLRRNPEDPPDGNLNGFNFWIKEVETTGEVERLPRAFMSSGEYASQKKK